MSALARSADAPAPPRPTRCRRAARATPVALLVVVAGALPARGALAQGAAARQATSQPFSEGESLGGLTRLPVATLFDGHGVASPAVAVTSRGEVVTAAVVHAEGRERVWLRVAPQPRAALGEGRPVSPGDRAWRPRLATAPSGDVWLAWCGGVGKSGHSPLRREVFVRRVRPGRPGPVRQVSAGTSRACDPDLSIGPDGDLHVVWEAWDAERRDEIYVAYRALSRAGRPRGPVERVSAGRFARRPAVLAVGRDVFVAWDSFIDSTPTGALDPDYDIFMRTRQRGRWTDSIAVDVRDGIQAAPDLAPAPGGGVLIAYHSSDRHGLVKWWTLRRLRGSTVQALDASDAAAEQEPAGEQQGAEFPAIAAHDGRVYVATRPSQGAFLQVVSGAAVSPPLDLTRAGWGGRGPRADLAVASDGTLLLARRSRRGAVLERFAPDPGSASPAITFSPADDAAKVPRQGGTFPAPALPVFWGAEHAGLRVYFGDPHMHSAHSDATGPPDEIYARAYVRGLDFAALTDHDYVVGRQLLPSMQDEIAWVTEAFDAREGFTTLHAYEWTTPPVPTGAGHRNIYFRDLRPAPLCGSKDACPDSAQLFAHLEAQKAIAVPHHTGWTGTEWRWADGVRQPLLEIVSVHGAFERPAGGAIAPRGDLAGMFAADGLAQGRRFGFAGGSDAHGLLWHHGIGRKRDPWACGLTGVIAPSKSRRALFDALQARRTFATSGVRLVVVHSAGGVGMGAEGEAPAPVEIAYRVEGTTERAELFILRDGEVVQRLPVSADGARGRWVDREVAPGAHVYFLRVAEGEGAEVEMAWSSPVFLEVRAPGQPAARRE